MDPIQTDDESKISKKNANNIQNQLYFYNGMILFEIFLSAAPGKEPNILSIMRMGILSVSQM
jgi:hypothetical protein